MQNATVDAASNFVNKRFPIAVMPCLTAGTVSAAVERSV